MEYFCQYKLGNSLYFFHLNREDKYIFNHWVGNGKKYVPNDGNLVYSSGTKFKLILFY